MNTSENIFVQRSHSIELTCRIGYVLEADSSQSASKIHCDGMPPVIPKCKGNSKNLILQTMAKLVQKQHTASLRVFPKKDSSFISAE